METQSPEPTTPQAMAIAYQQQGMVANTIATLLGGLEQPGHFRFGEKVLVACRTRDITNVGEMKNGGRRHGHQAPLFGELGTKGAYWVELLSCITTCVCL